MSSVWLRSRLGLPLTSPTVDLKFTLQENLSGVRVAQAYGREKRNLGEFRRVSRDYFNARLSAQRLVATYFPFVELLSEVAVAEPASVAWLVYLGVFPTSVAFTTWAPVPGAGVIPDGVWVSTSSDGSWVSPE